jgi:hypothetical protein
MLTYQVIATLSTEESFVGEIVAFNCTGNPNLYESAKSQAERYVDTFQRHGNEMIEKCAEATGATNIEYRYRIK